MRYLQRLALVRVGDGTAFPLTMAAHTLGRDSETTLDPAKLSVGIPPTESSVSRNQCILRHPAAPEASGGASSSAGSAGGPVVAYLEDLSTARNPTYLTRAGGGNPEALVAGTRMQLRCGDKITWYLSKADASGVSSRSRENAITFSLERLDTPDRAANCYATPSSSRTVSFADDNAGPGTSDNSELKRAVRAAYDPDDLGQTLRKLRRRVAASMGLDAQALDERKEEIKVIVEEIRVELGPDSGPDAGPDSDASTAPRASSSTPPLATLTLAGIQSLDIAEAQRYLTAMGDAYALETPTFVRMRRRLVTNFEMNGIVEFEPGVTELPVSPLKPGKIFRYTKKPLRRAEIASLGKKMLIGYLADMGVTDLGGVHDDSFLKRNRARLDSIFESNALEVYVPKVTKVSATTQVGLTATALKRKNRRDSHRLRVVDKAAEAKSAASAKIRACLEQYRSGNAFVDEDEFLQALLRIAGASPDGASSEGASSSGSNGSDNNAPRREMAAGDAIVAVVTSHWKDVSHSQIKSAR